MSSDKSSGQAIKILYIASGVTGFFFAWIASGFIASFVCNAIGFLYPAYKSVKAIESIQKDDDTEWLMYWLVFATFNVFEAFIDTLLFWFPFFFMAKCVFLLWCMAPITNNGSTVIYQNLIRPFVLENEADVDRVLEMAKKATMSAVADVAANRLQKSR